MIREKILTVPNIISLTRLVGIFSSLFFVFIDWPITALSLGMYSIASDFLDGYIARKFKQGTLLGEVLDQVIDSIVVSAFLMLAVYLHQLPFSASMVFLFREFWVYGIRRYAAVFDIRIYSNSFGRLGSFFTSFGLWVLFLSVVGQVPILYSSIVLSVGMATVWIGLTLSFIAACMYTIHFFKELTAISTVRN